MKKLIILLLVMAGVLLAGGVRTSYARDLMVINDRAYVFKNIRFTEVEYMSQKPIAELKLGMKYTDLDDSVDAYGRMWHKISLSTSQEGWVSDSDISWCPPPSVIDSRDAYDYDQTKSLSNLGSKDAEYLSQIKYVDAEKLLICPMYSKNFLNENTSYEAVKKVLGRPFRILGGHDRFQEERTYQVIVWLFYSRQEEQKVLTKSNCPTTDDNSLLQWINIRNELDRKGERVYSIIEIPFSASSGYIDGKIYLYDFDGSKILAQIINGEMRTVGK